MWRSGKKESRMRFWGRLLLGTASLGVLGWAWLFYQNVWQGAIPAFGSPDPHLAALKTLLAKYLAAGGGLLLVWWAGFVLYRSSDSSVSRENRRPRQLEL
ncbi:MAG: hypothetical protein GX316_07610 [Firmicutes bacterium]|nr:hypothetical protein [Bacillota bacterium]